MVQRVSTVTFQGVDVKEIDVQVQIANGLPAFKNVGSNYPHMKRSVMKHHKTLKICSLIILMLTVSGCVPIFYTLASIHPIAPIEYRITREKAEHGNKEAQEEVAEAIFSACYPMADDLSWYPACDKKECLKWNRLVAENGNPEAQTRLGGLYMGEPYSFLGGCGIENNVSEALKWYQRAADQNYAPACMVLAQFYIEGKHVAKDYYKAAQWYQKAADKGDSGAQLSLAKMYVSGQGVPKDTQKAREWGLKSTHDGILSYRWELATIYAEMYPPDYEEAYYWANLARALDKKLGLRGGNKSLEEFEKHLTMEQITAIQKRVTKEMARLCAEKIMQNACGGE